MKLQQNLTALGLYSGTISGHYGSITEAAVMNFQRKNGLSADGIAGAKTLAKIAGSSQRLVVLFLFEQLVIFVVKRQFRLVVEQPAEIRHQLGSRPHPSAEP